VEARPQPYVVAVRRDYPVSTWPPYGPPAPWTVAAVAAAALTAGVTTWERRSCGAGAQGPRVYDWASLPVRPALRDGWVHGVLVRRHPARTEEVAHYLVYAPAGTPLAEVVRAAGARWTIEDTFKQAKGLVGLDHYEVRSWRGWARHVTLALVALAGLTIARVKGGRSARRPARSTSRSPSRRSAASSSGSSGRPPGRRPPGPRSSPGPAGAAGTSAPPRSATAGAA
jgi:hypothetical protein